MLFLNNNLARVGNLLAWNHNPYVFYSMYLYAGEGLTTQIDRCKGRTAMTDVSAGPISHINSAGELVTTAAEVPWVTEDGFSFVGAVKQLCLYPNDPGEWALSGAHYADTGLTFGPFTEGTVTDTTGLGDRTYIWESGVSGSPSGILYFSVRYRAGTSGNVYLRCRDTGLNAIYYGTIGSVEHKQSDAGTFTIISDEYYSALGYYILKGSMLFTNLSNTLNIGIGPYSDTNKNIKVLGAAVSEHPAILSDLYIPAAGATVTTATRAGTSSQPISDQMLDALDGKADGVEELTNGDASDATYTDSSTHTLVGWTNTGTHNSGNKVTISGGQFRLISDSTYIGISQPALSINTYNEAIVSVASIADGDISLNINEADNILPVGVTTIRFVSNGSNPIELKRAVATGLVDAVVNSVSVKKISPASAQIQTNVTFPATVPTGIHKLIQFSDVAYIAFDGTNNLLILTDGTNTISVPFTPSIATKYPIWAGWSVDKMQLEANSVISAQADFTGTLLETDTTAVTLGDGSSTALISVGREIKMRKFSGVFKEAT